MSCSHWLRRVHSRLAISIRPTWHERSDPQPRSSRRATARAARPQCARRRASGQSVWFDQVLISKSRVVIEGKVQLQTSVMLSFATAEQAMLALRLIGMKGSLPVSLCDEAGTQVREDTPLRPRWPHLRSCYTLKGRRTHRNGRLM